MIEKIIDYIEKEMEELEELIIGETLSGNIVKESSYRGEFIAMKSVLQYIDSLRIKKS